jgi:hypothetical protein
MCLAWRTQINFAWYDIDPADPKAGLANLAYEEMMRGEDFAEFSNPSILHRLLGAQ